MNASKKPGVEIEAAALFSAAGADDAAQGDEPRLHFRRDPKITEAARKATVARVGEKNPQGGRQLDQATRQFDFIQAFGAEAAKVGALSTHLGDVTALYWLVAWMVVHRQRPNEQQSAAFRRNVGRALARQQDLLQAPEYERQHLADSMIFQLMLLQAAFEQATQQNDRAALDALSAGALRTAKENGVDLAAIELGDAGLTVRH
jgi:hypothetical protein